MGTVLSQGAIGRDIPVGYASRTLTKAEFNYPVVERELSTIVWRCKYFKEYLLGRSFSILTDHRPLVWIFNVKDPTMRLFRWRLLLNEYDYCIVYKRGSSNTNVDALSRIHVAETMPTEQEKLYIFQDVHMKPVGGHLGMNKTYERMKLFIT